MSHIRNLTILSNSIASISGSQIQLTGSVYGSQVSGTVAQFTTITGSNLVAGGVKYPTSDGDTGQILVTDGVGNLGFQDITMTINVKNLEATTITKGTPLYVTASGTSGNIAGVYRADAGNDNRMPAACVANQDISAGADGLAILSGFINGVNTSTFASGEEVYVAVGGGYTNVRPTGSAKVQPLGYVEKVDAAGSGVVRGPGHFWELPNITAGHFWVGASNGVPTTVASSSFAKLADDNVFTGTNTFENITADTITAREYHTELVSASIIYQSGSTKFGDTPGGALQDIHQFSGSVYITGSTVTLTGGSFSGNGSNLTSIDAGNISAGTLAVARGGTGLSSYTAGDLVYASGTTTLSKLALGTTNYVLTSNGSTAPQWSEAVQKINVTSQTGTNYLLTAPTNGNQQPQINFNCYIGSAGGIVASSFQGSGASITSLNASNISAGTLAVARGGTGQTSYTNGQLLIGNSTGNTLSKATLTEGTGITITNGAGSITVGLTNNSVTIGDTPVSLGATVTTFTGLDSVTSTTFNGSLNGNANTASKVAVAPASTNAAYNVAFVNGSSGNQTINVDNSALTYNPYTNTLTGTTIKATYFNVSTSGFLSFLDQNGTDTNAKIESVVESSQSLLSGFYTISAHNNLKLYSNNTVYPNVEIKDDVTITINTLPPITLGPISTFEIPKNPGKERSFLILNKPKSGDSSTNNLWQLQGETAPLQVWNTWTDSTVFQPPTIAAFSLSGPIVEGNTTSWLIPSLGLYCSRGNDTATNPVLAEDIIGRIVSFGNTSGGPAPTFSWKAGGYIDFIASSNFTDSVYGSHIAFYTANNASPTEKMRITSDGNVGIGLETNLTEKLEVDGNVKASKFIGDGSLLTNLDASSLTTGFLPVARIENYSIPNNKLVHSTIKINGTLYSLGSEATIETSNIDDILAGDGLASTVSNGQKTLSVDSSVVRNDGDQGIGTGTSSVNARLEIKQKSDSVGGGIRLVESGPSTSYWDIFLSDTAPSDRLDFSYGGTNKAYIDTSGNMTVAGTITELSTRKVKKNIRSLGSQLDKIKKLNPVSYRRKEIEDSKKEVGFISEEVREVYPELVNGEGVNYSKMVSILVSAVKELTEKVEQQEKQIKDLKSVVK